MASPVVQAIIGFVSSILATGSGNLDLPGVSEDVAGYVVTETLHIEAHKK